MSERNPIVGQESKWTPIGRVRSCFPQKFGIPRQSGLVPAMGTVEIFPAFSDLAAWQGLSEFSHIWLLYQFHATGHEVWQTSVRPPRLGGNDRVGVFASRSPFRPNRLGMSAVELLQVGQESGQVVLRVRGVDILDETPVIDVKPYLPYADAIAHAQGGFAHDAPPARLQVVFTPQAQLELEQFSAKYGSTLRETMVQSLALDPRPAYRTAGPDMHQYGMRLYDFDVKFHVEGEHAVVIERIEAAALITPRK